MMEKDENPASSEMLTMVQEILVSNAANMEILERAEQDLDLSRDQCKDDLKSHFSSVAAMLEEVYQESFLEVTTEYEKQKESLKRKEKMLSRCSLALMPELNNLRYDSADANNAVQRCKKMLQKLSKIMDLQSNETQGKVTFNFVPKLGKLKLGFLQLCENLPHDFTLRLLTQASNIKIGQQICCVIQGDFCAENLPHLEFGIRRNNEIVPSENLGVEGKVFSFSFSADTAGVYIILACLFGSPIDQSPLTLSIQDSGAMSNHLDEVDSTGVLLSKPSVSDEMVEGNSTIPTPVNKTVETENTKMAPDEGAITSTSVLKYSCGLQPKNKDLNHNEKEFSFGQNETDEIKDSSIKENEEVGQPKNKNAEQSDLKNMVGKTCVALWKEDGIWYNGQIKEFNLDGSFLVNFVDYGNTDNVLPTNIVKSASEIPENVPDHDVDEHVGNRMIKVLEDSRIEQMEKRLSKENIQTGKEETHLHTNQKMDCEKNVDIKVNAKQNKGDDDLKGAGEFLFQVGDACVAQWSEDLVWYNAIIQSINKDADASCCVTFTDYGNTDYVDTSAILKDPSMIPENDSIDENVNVTLVESENNNAEETFPYEETLNKESPNVPGKILAMSSHGDTADDSRQMKISDSSIKMITDAMKNVNIKTKDIDSLTRKHGPSLASDDEEIAKLHRYGNNSTWTENSIATALVENQDSKSKVIEQLNETGEKKKRNKSKPAIPRPLLEVNLDLVKQEIPEQKTIKSDASTWKAGDICLAKWNCDDVWYNAVIENKKIQFVENGNKQVVYTVTFTDYGNKDQVDTSRLVRSHDDLVQSGLGAILDENVKVDLANFADTNMLWKTGEKCLAKDKDGIWYNAKIEDVNSNGLLIVHLIDYDRNVEIDLRFLVRSYEDIQKSNKEMVDYNVKDESKVVEETDIESSIEGHFIGEKGIARWSADNVWYNATVQNVNLDGSLEVCFVDYGNTDIVNLPFFVKNTSEIKKSGETILLDENVEEHENYPSLPPTLSANTTIDFTFLPIQTVKEKHPGLEFSRKRSSNDTLKDLAKAKMNGSMGSISSTDFDQKSIESSKETNLPRRYEFFDIIEHVTKTDDDHQELVVKSILNVTENLTSPIGITILPNKNCIIGSAQDDSAKILSPDGKLLSTIKSVRPFQKPTDMTTLSTGEFVVRDDVGLQLFTKEGDFIKALGENQLDKCFGVSEDEDGNIITINVVRPSRHSKPGSKGKGGLTDVGETDLFFISRESGEVVKRIELADIISDKSQSKCRFLNYHNNTVYIVDLGLDCIYKLKIIGIEVSIIGETGSGPGQFRDPAGIVVDHLGNFIVADSRNHRLQIFDKTDKFIGIVKVDKAVNRPSGIYLDKELGDLYVLNYWGNSMVKYRIQ